ncbi:hypothetical protein [Microbacterium sp. LWS13-1.2]|uniref:Uncharacterized protein n=1 Tax=Microbacterium sp. LWS13-1.2 TaxID=3135264 RepID=A0AAU6SAL2_9MICO
MIKRIPESAFSPLEDSLDIELTDDETWSWDDLNEIAEEVTAASGGAVVGSQSWGFEDGGLNNWLRQHGESLFAEDGSPEVTASAETLAARAARSGGAVTGLLGVGVAGVHGHGRSHVDAVLAGADFELVAVADPRGGRTGRCRVDRRGPPPRERHRDRRHVVPRRRGARRRPRRRGSRGDRRTTPRAVCAGAGHPWIPRLPVHARHAPRASRRGGAPRAYAFERISLLDDLAGHIRDGRDLLAPLHRTGAFTRVLEAIVTGPPATPIDRGLVRVEASGGETFRTVSGVEDAVERVAWEGRTFRDLGRL